MSVAHRNQKSVVLGTLADSYRKWLETLNYSASAIYHNPRYVAAFIAWAKITSISQINSELIADWFEHLSTRKNKRRTGGLSHNYMKNHRSALSQFNRFLRETDQGGFELNISFKARESLTRPVLSRKEIARLYEATDHYPDPGIKDKGLLAARERAILGLYYGCGLRRNEGIHVALKDLDLSKNLLHVRKGKNYRERYVPIAVKIKKDFVHYLDYVRPQLLRKQTHDRFLVSWTGHPLGGLGTINRLHILAQIARIEKPVGLHTLRHSIATHLLQSGMKLEQIARFLGHSSLESTQIYTHVSAEMK
ncbi:Tyrosine recombinase xerD [Fulvivirga imtechensis AK7]|uniref:Tyrosine recombinase xerD n=1 Tax=Fulvivirga imtechensis AK7 TaxID=1237149 RepID=L8JIW4_9BACT|nr:tyrosine-type recombinase/integrase [Fulvivirga imtechensis]ELR68188.1 Tyrosine recombinase xerD [Fulvivirga imtechensis AK7]